MQQSHIESFANIPQPPESYRTFLNDLRSPVEFCTEGGCPPGATLNCLAHGVEFFIDFPKMNSFPHTAMKSLHSLLMQKGIFECKKGYPIRLAQNSTLAQEEYIVRIQPQQTILAASDADGLRRAIYFLEDRIQEAEGSSATEGNWQRRPFVKNRISRCFFGPTYRPPHYNDELTAEVDYYPEEYLNRLAHEGINGLWLTMYFRDLPSTIFPNRGKDASMRLKKLRKVVEKCGEYGIRIFVFFSEPKYFGNGFLAMPFSDAARNPEIIGAKKGNGGLFCTSTDVGKQYLRESVSQIFEAVPKLGGIINIMYGEDNGSCPGQIVSGVNPDWICPVCSKRDIAEIYQEQAEIFTQSMHRYNPEAEFIGWFYAPGHRNDSSQMQQFLRIAEKWPADASLMFNFESGGTPAQLGKKRVVFDYSLAYIGPSQLFAKVAKRAVRPAAKIQVGCSHEDASIPYMPVPANLYEKYRFMSESNISSVMQCWYFGNYPGMMNKAAGELSFLPFPDDCKTFVVQLVRPQWKRSAETAAEAFLLFSEAYKLFPANLLFKWYGPLHNCIAWPLFLFPVDKPIKPSWKLEGFPDYSGDRIGECIGYHHTLAEALELCLAMSGKWKQGFKLLNSLQVVCRGDRDCLGEIRLAEAIGLQMQSACNVLQFYLLREDMLYYRRDHLAEMETIVRSEIRNSKRMCELCEQDSRLGYHSEAEGYLFYPEKLRARINLLQELIEEDFPMFSIQDSRWDVFTGSKPEGASAEIYRRGSRIPALYKMQNNTSWQAEYDDKVIRFMIHNVRNKHLTLTIEPCRCWMPVRIDCDPPDIALYTDCDFASTPKKRIHYVDNDIIIEVPLELFDGYRKDGFPMRVNLWGTDYHWVDPKLWPYRLEHNCYNPEGAGWLEMVCI